MPSSKKIIDIISPEKSNSKIDAIKLKSKKKTKRKSMKISILKLIFTFVLLVILVGIGVIHFMYQSAAITIFPNIKEVSINEGIIVTTEVNEINVENKKIPGNIVSFKNNATQLFDATGLQKSKTKAQGTITVFNERSVPQILIANTRFVSEDGFVFLTIKRITIPAQTGSTPGSLDILVRAAESGPNYNIEASNFSVPGLAGSSLFTMIYGESLDSMQGGSTGDTVIVTQIDIDKAEKSLVEILISRTKQNLKDQLPEGFVVSDQGFSVEIIESSSSVKSGAALKQFNYSVVLVVKAISFKFSDLEELSNALLSFKIGDDVNLKTKTFNIAYDVKDSNIDRGELRIDLTSSVDTYALVDTTKFAEFIENTTPLTAETILRGEDGVSNVEVKLWPFWLVRVPSDLNKIEVMINVD